MNLKEIINYLQETISITALKVSDESIFEQAVKIYISNKIGEQKKENIKQIKEKPKEPASKKQLYLLNKLGYQGKTDLTKQEAYILIKEIKGGKK